MSKGTRRRNSRCIIICVYLYSFSIIVGVLLQRLLSPFNFISMLSSRHFITYFLGSFFRVCVCLCASLCMFAYVHMSVHVCAAGADHRRALMSSLPLSARSLLFDSGVPRVYQHSAVNTRTYTRLQHPAFRLWAQAPTLAFIWVPGLWTELLLLAGEMSRSRPMSRLLSLCNIACNDMLLCEK